MMICSRRVRGGSAGDRRDGPRCKAGGDNYSGGEKEERNRSGRKVEEERERVPLVCFYEHSAMTSIVSTDPGHE